MPRICWHTILTCGKPQRRIGIADRQAAQDRQFRGDSQLRADELGIPRDRDNQPHKRKLAAFGFGRPRDNLPMVVLAFGRYGTIPAVGAIFSPEGSDEYPGRRDKILTMAEAQAHNARWRKWRDERHAEFEWLLLGRSEARGAPVVSLDDARA